MDETSSLASAVSLGLPSVSNTRFTVARIFTGNLRKLAAKAAL
jgi:hypothetical protein